MSTDDFISKLNKQVAEIEKTNKPLELAVRSMMAVQSKRVFFEGKNSDGNVIGEYSKKEVYVSPNTNKSLPKFPLKGKDGQTKFKNGNTHKSGYFENYLAFKTSIGRNKRIKTVDLFLTGSLQRNWANSDVLDAAKARKINQHRYLVSLTDFNQRKVLKYDRVFDLSAGERALFLKTIQFELVKALS